MNTTVMEPEITWEYHSPSTDKRIYVDFRFRDRLHRIIFRACFSDEVADKDLAVIIERIAKAQKFFESFAQIGAEEIINESSSTLNWGQGWEWREATHSLLPSPLVLRYKTAWYTNPYNGDSKKVQSMGDRYGEAIDVCGLELLQAHDHHSPTHLFYAFREWGWGY